MIRFARAKRLTSVVFPLLLTVALASADSVTIDHKPAGCIVAGRFPVISARFDPAANVGRGRVYFRATGGAYWYFVEMKLEQGEFVAALPKPAKNTAKIDYYIEAVDKTFAASRTAEYAADVVAGPGECGKDGLVAVALASAKLVVGSVPGAPALPAGFSAVGIASTAGGAAAGAAGGIGTTTLVIGGVAVAGAAAAAVAVTSGGDKATSTPTATGPFTGTWSGTIQSRVQGTGTFQLTLAQSGTSVTGTFGAVYSRWSDSGSLTGTASGNSLQARMTPRSAPECPLDLTVNVSGSTMQGNYATVNCPENADSGSVSGTRQ